MPFNDAAKNAALDSMDESTPPTTAAITFVGIHASSGDPGTSTNSSGTEASGGSPAYARQGVVWGAAASGQKSNTGALTFDVPAGTYAYFTLYNHVTANSGNYRGFIPFGGAAAIKGFAASDVIANDKFFSGAHGLSNNDRVVIYNVFAESLPTGTGLTEGALLFVVGATTDTFQLALTSGGSAIDVTATGELYWQRVIPETFASQGQITVAIGALVLDATAM